MITDIELGVIFNKIVSDDNFCRLVYYGENPFDVEKPDIITMDNYKEMMKDVITFAPQTGNLTEQEGTRICMYKHHTKMRIDHSAIRHEAIQFDIYVPHRLVRTDMRVYQLENKLASLLDGQPLGIGHLDYVDGHFIPMPNINAFTMYVMSFAIAEGRQVRNGRF